LHDFSGLRRRDRWHSQEDPVNEAVWYVIEDGTLVVCGALVALSIVLSILSMIFQSDRFDFWAAWNLRKGGDKRLKLD
jgi:hypothetical protein